MAKKIYVGAPTEIPIYETQIEEADITTSNILTYFTRSNGDYYFVGSGSTWTTNNGGVDNSIAQTTLTAKMNMEVSFDYSYSSEARYDKFTLTIANNIIEDAVSGTTTTKSYTGTISQGQIIDFKYIKDSSNSINDDKCTFSNMHVKCFKQTQTGVETKSLARKVKKVYMGIPTDFPIYETTTTKETIPLDTYSKITEYFNRSDSAGDYYFSAYGAGYFETNNRGAADSTAEIYLYAKTDMEISFDYSYSSEANYDKFYLTVAGVTIEDGVSGVTTNKNFTGTLLSGQSIYARYTKDHSADAYDDGCKLFNFIVYLTKDTQVQIGTETKEVARKLKRAYIGVGGVARPCFSDGKLTYFGTTTPLSSARYGMGATTVGKYALFAGGCTTNGGGYTTAIDVYDESLTRISATSLALSTARGELAATTIGDYALFACGYNGNSVTNGTTGAVDIYDASLTKISTKNIAGRGYLSAVAINNYALFAGGHNSSSYYSIVNAFDTSLTTTTIATLSVGRSQMGATTVGNYALFAGGSDSNTAYNTIDVYDNTLAKIGTTLTIYNACKLTATTIGNYALFAGGSQTLNSGYLNSTRAYDVSLTEAIVPALSVARRELSSTTVGDYALFAGGVGANDGNTSFKSTVDVYDSSLIRTVSDNLSSARQNAAGVTIGDYVLFAGGWTGTSTSSSVDVYMV